jgi:hypothetical protein
MEMDRMVMEALKRLDQLQRTIEVGLHRHEGDILGDGIRVDGEHYGKENNPLPNSNIKQKRTLNNIAMTQMFQEARTPLYQGCPTNHLATILLLLNLIIVHGVSNAFANDFFHY